jgi:hypothetical protein
MSDLIDQTPSVIGLDRFTAELGDQLEDHARALPVSGSAGPIPRARRWPRRLAIAATAGATVAVVVLAVGIGTERSGSPAVASAASVMRQSAAALARDSGRLLPTDAYWHSVVDVTMRHIEDEAAGFQYTSAQRWETWQARDGSGRERLTNGRVKFVTPADRTAWRAADSPELADPPSDRRLAATDRPFAFGSDVVGYKELESLPVEPEALARLLSQMVERQRGEIPGTFDSSEARAYLLLGLIRDGFRAPTSPALRAALYDLAASVPDLELAGATRDHAGRTGTAVAAVLGDARFELIVDPRTGALLETRRILLRRSHQFPGMTPGLISRATFLQSNITTNVPTR